MFDTTHGNSADIFIVVDGRNKDLKIIFGTVGAVLKRDGISSETSVTMEEFTGSPNAHEETSQV